MTTRWWERNSSLALLTLAATAPLWFVRVPPLIDLLGHMGRYHVQLNLATHPLLQRNWDYHWTLIGNLGCDLLMQLIGPLFGVERGGVVLAGLLLVVMLSGMVRLARAAHGHLPATAWAAFPFAMAYPWHYGLANFWLGTGLALHAAAMFWNPLVGGRSSSPRRIRLSVAARSGLLLLAGLLLWVAHIYGWAVFAVLATGRAIADRPVRAWPGAVLTLWPLAAPLIVMAALRYGAAGAAAETLGWGDLGYKALALTWTLRDQWQWLDVASLVAAIVLIYAGFRSKAFVVDRGLAFGAAGLLAALLVLPYQFLGSAYADARLWPVAFIVALLAFRPAPRHTALAANLAFVAGTVFAVRIVATTLGFQAYDRDFARHLSAFDAVRPGSRVAVFTAFPCEMPWRRPRIEHLDGIAIVRRDLFTNGQWDVPGAELLVPLAARGSRYNADPSELVMTCGSTRDALAERVAGFPRDRFDYVWVTGYQPSILPHYAGMTPLFADDATILYRIEK